MIKQRRTTRRSRQHQGFTLVEVLIAIIVLLVGVIAALRIFPPGYNAYLENQQANIALKMAKSEVESIRQNPGSLPDYIGPVDDNSPEAQAALATFSFSDLTPVSFRAKDNTASPYIKWLINHQFSSADEVVPGRFLPHWPLWEPASMRVMRKVMGEKVQIPAEFTSQELARVTRVIDADTVEVSTGDQALLTANASVLATLDKVSYEPNAIASFTTIDATTGTLNFRDPYTLGIGGRVLAAYGGSPMYLPRFGPIATNVTWNNATMHFDLAGTPPVAVYDLAYRQVTQQELRALEYNRNKQGDELYFSFSDEDGVDTYNKLRFLPLKDHNKKPPVPLRRTVRLSFFCMKGLSIVKVGPVIFDLPATGTSIETLDSTNNIRCDIESNDSETTLTLQDGWRILPGSEQINRALIYKTTNPWQLQSGEFTLGSDITNGSGSGMLLGTVYFAQKDAGRTVKMDYTVADWNVLHEDVTVDSDGYISLAVPNPKLTFTPAFPREPFTWGLYGPWLDPMKPSAVMGLVDLSNGIGYEVHNSGTADGQTNVNQGLNTQRAFVVRPVNGAVVPGMVQVFNPADAAISRLRVGSFSTAPDYCGKWTPGQQYAQNQIVFVDRVPALDNASYIDRPGWFTCTYVAQPTHTADATNRPGSGANWKNYWTYTDGADWSALRGKTFRVFYRARRDWTLQVYRTPANFWYRSFPIGLTVDELLIPGNNRDVNTLDWQSMTGAVGSDGKYYLVVPGVYEGQAVAVDYQYRKSANGPLLRATGEAYTVSPRISGKRVSLFALQNLPDSEAPPPTVRGLSVTVRVLWAQPRAGMAQVFERDPVDGIEKVTSRTINERWRAKGITVVLPATND